MEVEGPSLTIMDLQPNYTHSSISNKSSHLERQGSRGRKDTNESSMEEVTTQMARAQLKLDNRALAESQKKEHGAIDFVTKKAREFLDMQSLLPQLDYNSMNSEKEVNLAAKADYTLKKIAI